MNVDVVRMLTCNGKGYLTQCQDDLSERSEARPVSSVFSGAMAKFLLKDVVTQHGCFGKLACDGCPENNKGTEDLLAQYRIPRIVVSAYSPMTKGMIEHGHQTTLNSLAKLNNGGYSDWVQNLFFVMCADWTTV